VTALLGHPRTDKLNSQQTLTWAIYTTVWDVTQASLGVGHRACRHRGGCGLPSDDSKFMVGYELVAQPPRVRGEQASRRARRRARFVLNTQVA
jgi:hypothetical protein